MEILRVLSDDFLIDSDDLSFFELFRSPVLPNQKDFQFHAVL